MIKSNKECTYKGDVCVCMCVCNFRGVLFIRMLNGAREISCNSYFKKHVIVDRRIKCVYACLSVDKYSMLCRVRHTLSFTQIN